MLLDLSEVTGAVFGLYKDGVLASVACAQVQQEYVVAFAQINGRLGRRVLQGDSHVSHVHVVGDLQL